MKVEFKKIPQNGLDFKLKFDNIDFYGVAKKLDKDIVKATGTIKGSFIHCCDRCGEDFIKNIDQKFEIYASRGIYKNDEYLNVIEFFDDFIDFDRMLQSELESFKCDYLYCTECR